MTIHLATDHAGFAHKEAVWKWLKEEGFTLEDHGAFELDNEDDFTDFVALAARKVSESDGVDKAIVFGGSGQGEAMAANRLTGVRAAVFYGGDDSIPVLSRQHNDSNVLSIGARFVDINTAKKVIWDWLHTARLEDDKYLRRNHKLDLIK